MAAKMSLENVFELVLLGRPDAISIGYEVYFTLDSFFNWDAIQKLNL